MVNISINLLDLSSYKKGLKETNGLEELYSILEASKERHLSYNLEVLKNKIILFGVVQWWKATEVIWSNCAGQGPITDFYSSEFSEEANPLLISSKNACRATGWLNSTEKC